MNNDRTLKIVLALLVALSFLAVVAVNALANILPLNGVNTGVLSDELPNLFVPAGLTFSIWGLIYLLLALYAVAVLVQAFGKKGPPQAWQIQDGALFLVNAAANVAWILAWHWRLVPVSLVLMLVILTTLVLLQERNYKRVVSGGALAEAKGSAGLRRFALTTPINVYLGWICVATIANVTALFVQAGWNGFGVDPRIWTLVVIVAGFAVALALMVRRNAYAAPLVVVWAYAGIVLKRLGADRDSSLLVWAGAAAAAAAILVILALRFVRSRRAA